MSEFIKAITANEFEQEVIVKSKHVPVLVDFWADWCAPCKQLMPVLHQLVESLQGSVYLATVDTDAEQELAMQYGIRSLPTVVLFQNGEMVNQFMGVKPESEIRQFIEPYLKPQVSQESQTNSENLQKAMELINQGQVLQAIPYLAEDSSLQGRLLLIKIYLQEGEIKKAKQLFSALTTDEQQDEQAQVIKTTIELIEIAEKSNNKKLQEAIEHTIAINPHQGIEQILEVLSVAKLDEKDEIKKALIIAFNLIQDAALVSQLRRKMAALIF
jgi:putative thioredoxin